MNKIIKDDLWEPFSGVLSRIFLSLDDDHMGTIYHAIGGEIYFCCKKHEIEWTIKNVIEEL